MSFIPARFMVRLRHRCLHVGGIPDVEGDELFDLPAKCRLNNYAGLDGAKTFADVRVAWNAGGIAVQATITGKEAGPVGDVAKPRFSDGVSIWIDTRGDRTSHRASRTCHQFHLLPAAEGADRDEPCLLQMKINRAQQDAPLCGPDDVPFRMRLVKRGYRVEAFFPDTVLNGYDPEENPVLGFWYAVRDAELGEQTLGVGMEFPYSDDPSLWASLELVKE
ncbi:MAG: hypothetical protein K1X57_16575 [Gemmataceae bacterium]|nr:hypothetical protein [Gemmataceae bacterium]